jgi:MFS family permease
MGVGLGVFIPANNTVVMAAMPGRLAATAGGMVNMTRGLGTAVGVALVTLVVHLARVPSRGHLAVPVTMALLAGAALAAAVTARSASSQPRVPRQARSDMTTREVPASPSGGPVDGLGRRHG